MDIFLYRSFKTKHTFNDTKLQDTPRLHVLCRLPSLPPEEDVDLLFNPVLVVRSVGVGGLLVDQAGELCQLITGFQSDFVRRWNRFLNPIYLVDKLNQLAYIVGD